MRSSDMGEQVMVPGASDYYEWTRQGFVFTASSVTLAALPIFSTLTNSPTLWNPASSGKVVVPMFLNLTGGVVGSGVMLGVVVAYLANTGDGVGTGAPVATFTNIAPISNMLGRGAAKTRFSGAVVTFTTQPTVFMQTGLNVYVYGTPATAEIINLQYDFKGSVIMPPGTSISIGANVASVTTFLTSIVFAEFPAYTYFNA
jgi:hypothetical protein